MLDTELSTGFDPELYRYNIKPFNLKETRVSILNKNREGEKSGELEEENLESRFKKKTRKSIPHSSKQFLETIFKTKRTPNNKERQIIADKCGLTPLQVRVWVSSKY